MRILVAEDSTLLREGLTALLERAGHSVAGAVTSAPELVERARELLREEAVDLLLSDVRMPPDDADDGLRAAVELRREHPRLPVVMLSQYVEQSFTAALLADGAGAVGYLLKDRVAHVHDFLHSLETVRSGGIVVDPEVVSALMDRRHDQLASLTARELEVLALVSEGATNQQIAQRLHLSQGAVVKHVSAGFDKLGIGQDEGNRRVLAVLAYLRAGRGR